MIAILIISHEIQLSVSFIYQFHANLNTVLHKSHLFILSIPRAAKYNPWIGGELIGEFDKATEK